jgi:xanthine dehydrogenase accessory factor
MNELERISREATALVEQPYLLATVVRVSGSSYRRPGARMLVAGDRWLSGCVSGGCLEGDVMLRGAHRCRDGAVVVTYDSTTDGGEPWLGCNGVVDVLLEHIAAGADNDALAFARACFAAERTGTLVTIIRAHEPSAVGTRIAIGPAVALSRPVTDPALRAAVAALVYPPPGVYELAGVTVLIEAIAPSPQLFVLGSGHDVAPVVALATSVGFRVTVADRAIREPSRLLAADRLVSTGGDRAKLGALIAAAGEAYVVIMHHQLAADRETLVTALASSARYIGVLGPARRTSDLLAELGHPDDRRLHAPIGLDIGAETPEQIALAIVGELQAVAREVRGGKLRDRARALHADVATIVLAAGGSHRLGHPKQLVEVDGEPLVRRIAGRCIAMRGGPVSVVLGAHASHVAAALEPLHVAQLANDAWREGIASSIRCGVRWAQTTNADALLIVLGDQPLVTGEHLAALRDAWLAGAPIAASRFDGMLGAPAIFDRSRWPQLAQLEGDRGAGRLLRADDVVAIDWPDGAVDVDTADDVRLLARR